MNVFSDRISAFDISALSELKKRVLQTNAIDFSSDNSDIEAIPYDSMRQLCSELFVPNGASTLQYSSPEGFLPLRNWIKEDMRERNCFRDGEDDVIITSGAQQAIEIITKIICNEGETIICENPASYNALNAFRSYRAHIVGIDADNDGMRTDLLEDALKKYPRTALYNAEFPESDGKYSIA